MVLPYNRFLKADSDKILVREILSILILSQVRSYEMIYFLFLEIDGHQKLSSADRY